MTINNLNSFFIKMSILIILCPVLLAGVQTLTIDSQLGTSIEDCFIRLSIGEQLPSTAIYRNVTELMTRECEQICKQDKQCQAYDYGVGAKGNATCNLSNIDEKEIKEKSILGRHPDYDVYVRRFQCEQSPPSPMPLHDDPGPDEQKRPDNPDRPEGPLQRPVFRPDDEIFNDDYLISADLRPFESGKPYRPDDYSNSKPDNDVPPSYGSHRPQEIPYEPIRPDHGFSRPQDTQYRPERPIKNQSYNQKPSDELNFQGYGQPNRPEKPDYNYIIRPNRKPYQNSQDEGYGRPDRPSDIGHPSGPIGPPSRPYRFDRPNRPRPDNAGQYASNFDHSSQNDNSIHVEIYDPPRPYRPIRGSYYGHQGYGYLTQNSYAQNHGTITEIGGYSQNPPLDDNRPDPTTKPYGQYGYNGYRPQNSKPNDPTWNQDYDKPVKGYTNQNSFTGQTGYGSNQSIKGNQYGSQNEYYQSQSDQSSYNSHNHHIGYGDPGQNEPYKPSKPDRPNDYHQSQSDQSSYNSHNDHIGYGDPGQNQPYKPSKPDRPNDYQSQSDQLSYNSQNHHIGYGDPGQNEPYKPSKPNRPNDYHQSQSDQPSYNTQNYHNGYGDTGQNRPNKPLKPDRPNDYGPADYGQNSYQSQHSYSSSQSNYHSNQHVYESQVYGRPDQSYSNRPNYKPSYNDYGSYGQTNGQNHDQGNHYGETNHGSYGSTQSSHGQQDFYNSNQNSYGNTQNTYQDDRYKGSKGSYGGSQSSYHGASQGISHDYHLSNGNKGSYDAYPPSQSGYGGQSSVGTQFDQGTKGSYSNQSSYGNKGSYGTNQDYSNSQNVYGTSQIDDSYTTPSYGSNQNAETSHKGRPQRPNNKKPNDSPAYYKPNTESENPGYNVKPVYENEMDRPHAPGYTAGPGGEVVTSRPVAVGDYGAGYREPGKEDSTKACFRRVLVGRRALRSHVRRVVSGQSLEDCKTECAVEHRFPCESFNYRLDPSFRGKSLCELMTKPIEAFDLRRDFAEDKDYDFYERDRNSLEPYCPDSLRGQGLLHSGYLTTQNRAEDRWGGGYVGSYGQRKHDDTNFIPYQIGIRRKNDPREHENWGQYGGYYGGYDYYKDRNDYYKSQSHWNLNNAIDRAYSSEGVRPLTTIIRPHKSMADFDYNKLAKDTPWNERYGSWKREKWNSSGSSFNSFDYGGYHHYGPTFELEGRSDENDPKDCSSRRSAGMSLSSGSIRRSLYAKNVVECEASCFEEREFKCVSYSYRYSNSRGSDNCFLSERPYRGLEMSADSSSDVYAMPQSHDCVNVNYDPWVESECFWHVRSGAAVTGAAVRAALTVAGLGACEAECIRASGFFCRGFSFRFEAPITGEDLENCILTSSPPASLPPSRAAHHELYARGRAGRGCQPALHDAHPEPGTQCYLQYDSAAQLSPSAVRGRARVRDEGACGVACTDAPFRCLSYSFKNNAPPDRDNCFLSEIRLFDLQRGVDYVHSTDDWLFAFDLFNGQCWRKIHGPDYDEPTHELPRPILTSGSEESYPVSGPSGPGYSESDPPYISEGHIKPFKPTIYKPVYPEPSGPDFEPHYETSGHFYKPTYSIEPSGSYKPGFAEPSGPDFKPHFEPVGPVLKPVYPLNEPPFESSRPGLKPLYPVQPNFKPRPVEPSVYRPEYPVQKPGYVPKPAYRPPEHDIPFVPTSPPGYRPGRPGFNPGSKPGFEGDREDGIAVSWRHYTVSGFPCRAGTSCAQNHVAGHWACEPEGGEIGSWDYCCAPTHRCGYSEGFNKPWCYVGPESDQWRPCSEKYYPYHQHNVPHPSQANRDETSRPSGPSRPHGNRPGPYLSEADRRYWDELYKNGPQAYYDRYGNPLPGYTRVPTSDPPHIKPEYSRPAPGSWAPAQGGVTRDGLGVPRYWPVAYLHKGPPPNMTYFRYNETTTTEMPKPAESRDLPDDRDSPDQQTLIDKPKIIDNHRGEKKRNISDHDEELHIDIDKTTTAKTVSEVTEIIERVNKSEIESTTSDKDEDKMDLIDGIDDKLLDFSKSIEVFDIEDAKKSAKADLKTLRAEERQIEEIGRLLASRRDGKVVLEKRSQKELASKNIAVDEDLLDFNFGNKFPVERRGVVRKVTKDEIERDRNTDRSLEVSETTFVRPPRVLATTENIRKAIVNGKIFYDATIREQRDVLTNATRRSKSLRPLEDRAPSVINSANFGKKKIIKTRNVNPVRRVRRVYRKRYNPEEVRRRLLERDRAKESSVDSSRKI